MPAALVQSTKCRLTIRSSRRAYGARLTSNVSAALGSIAQLISQPKRSSKTFQSSNRPGSEANAQNIVRGNLHRMNQISVADILELPVQERIQLVEVIWESIAAFPNAVEVSPELKTELNARLADFERNPEAGYSWDEVKAHLKSGSWRTA